MSQINTATTTTVKGGTSQTGRSASRTSATTHGPASDHGTYAVPVSRSGTTIDLPHMKAAYAISSASRNAASRHGESPHVSVLNWMDGHPANPPLPQLLDTRSISPEDQILIGTSMYSDLLQGMNLGMKPNTPESFLQGTKRSGLRSLAGWATNPSTFEPNDRFKSGISWLLKPQPIDTKSTNTAGTSTAQDVKQDGRDASSYARLAELHAALSWFTKTDRNDDIPENLREIITEYSEKAKQLPIENSVLDLQRRGRTFGDTLTVAQWGAIKGLVSGMGVPMSTTASYLVDDAFSRYNGRKGLFSPTINLSSIANLPMALPNPFRNPFGATKSGNSAKTGTTATETTEHHTKSGMTTESKGKQTASDVETAKSAGAEETVDGEIPRGRSLTRR